ncbi:MAG: hypothetical protein R6U95_01525 [Bacteroidales bacterium]
MKKTLLYICICFFVNVHAQTVIKMDIPEIPDNPFTVHSHINEDIPTDIPVIISSAGFTISGGSAPFEFSWIENNSVIANGNTVTFTTQNIHSYYVEVTDSNNCSVTIPLQTSTAIDNTPNQNILSIYPTSLAQFSDLHIDLHTKSEADMYMYNAQGILQWTRHIKESCSIPIFVSPGIYWIVTHINNQRVFNTVIVK